MTLRVAVDFGTSSTCVAVSVDGRDPDVVMVDGAPLMSSAVYAGPDGRLFVGQEADRQAALDPSRYEPHPKRRVDETELLLGNTVVPIGTVIRAVLARGVAEARRLADHAHVDQLVLTHPADWGNVRTAVLRTAGATLASQVALVPEPVAAAAFHAAAFAANTGPLAVLDLGGGTVDVSVVQPAPFRVLATRGDPSFGGADIDQLLLEYVGTLVAPTDPDAWLTLVQARDLPARRRRRALRADIRGAKETLSRHPYTDVPLPAPFADVHVTRTDLDRIITPHLSRAVDLTLAAIADAQLAPAQLAGIFLVGGSSRIPLVARLLTQRTGTVPVTLDQPETVVARGALRAVAADPVRTGRVPAVAVPPPAVPRPVPLPPPARPRTRRRPLVIAAAVVLLVAVVGVSIQLLTRPDQPPTQPRSLSQYEYTFPLPDGWRQAGGDPTKLRTDVTPTAAGSDSAALVLVQETRLSFDADTDRARAVDKLRTDFSSAGPNFTDFADHSSFAGRDTLHYREARPTLGATVDWYVLFHGRTQVSVGCQSTQDTHDRVTPACATIVHGITLNP